MDNKIKISEYYELNKTQYELDFVDTYINGDKTLFVDPYALSKRKDDWSILANNEVVNFFQLILRSIKDNPSLAKEMLGNLSEPNETHLGLSEKESKGKGVSGKQSNDLYMNLSESKAVQTGFVKDLSDCELMVAGIGYDKISDITINIIRKYLIEYTQEQCNIHSIPMLDVASGKIWNSEQKMWTNDYTYLPVINDKKLLLVPKRIVVYKPFLSSNEYYNRDILEYLQAEHIRAMSSLVHLLKDGTRKVHKKVLKEQDEYKYSKDFIYSFSNEHPELLGQYKNRKETADNYNLDVYYSDDEDLEKVIAQELIEKLKVIKAGKDDAYNFHNYCMGALEFIFYPNLTIPKKEDKINNGRKSIDITYQNSADKGFFFNIHTAQQTKSNIVMVECKNYSHDPENPELDQLAGRFSPMRGKFGILLARNFTNTNLFIERCRDTAKEDKGVIIPLADSHIEEMLNLIKNGNRDLIDDYMYEVYRKIIT